jgi:GAF domain-containing protein
MSDDQSKAGDRQGVDRSDISVLERITPLARQINCLDMQRIAEICVTGIPELIGIRFASVYVLDETSNILHLLRHNHPYLINKIVSLNQNPPSPMVMAVRSREIILTDDIDFHKEPVIRKSQRQFLENYRTKSCLILPLVCQERVVGVLNLADKAGDSFNREDISLVELLGQLVGGPGKSSDVLRDTREGIMAVSSIRGPYIRDNDRRR